VPGYQLGELLGRGATGTVWAATRATDGRRVAVKVVPVGSPELVHALAREIAVLGRVDVEGLVGFHEALGLDAAQPAVALVLDHLGGGSLERAVRARGHLSVGESVTVLAPVARALAGLHGLGVVHGDVTPANVLLEQSGRPFLGDLGVARIAGEVPGSQTGNQWGTPGFVAPEVLQEGAVTTAADVYAVGALAWWCVTGSAPEPGALRAPLEDLAPGLPPAWSEVTHQALLGDPALRPTAAELALAYFDSAPCEPLRLVVGNDETSLLTQRLRRPPGPDASPVSPRRRRLVLGPPRGRAAALATLAALVVVLGVGTLGATGVVGLPGWLRVRATPPTSGPPPIASTTRPGNRSTTAATNPATTSATAQATTQARAGAATDLATDLTTDLTKDVTKDPTADLATDPAAPGRDAHALMVSLAALRAEAMTSRSLDVLARLDAPGSAALAQDTALVADLTASGTAWRAVRLEVVSARMIARRAGAATVDAVVATAAYRVVEATGREVARPAAPGQPMRFDLVWSDGRWRVERVSEAPD
jgi:serine/threonine protein kinase